MTNTSKKTISLQKYFVSQQKESLPIDRKVSIYHTFIKKTLLKKQRKNLIQISQRFSLNKFYVYISSLIIILGFTYVLFYFQYQEGKDFGSQYTPSIIHAERIGTIINAKGYFEIINENGQRIITEYVSNNDIITLDANSYLSFRMNDTLEAHIMGPAKFSIHRVDNELDNDTYHINMISGEYVAVTGDPSKIDSDDILITTAAGLTIRPEKSDNEPTDVVIAQIDQKAVVLNRGKGKINIGHSKNGSEKPIGSVENKSMGVVDEQKEHIEQRQNPVEDTTDQEKIESSPEELFSEITNVLLSVVQSDTSITDINGTGSIDTATLEESTTDTIGSEDREVPVSTPSQIGDKVILSADQLYKVEQLLYAPFVKKDLEQILAFSLQIKPQNMYTMAISTLMGRITRIYDILGFANPYRNPSISNIKKSIGVLGAMLDRKYIVPTHIKHNLSVMTVWLTQIERVSPSEDIDTSIIVDSDLDKLANMANITILDTMIFQ